METEQDKRAKLIDELAVASARAKSSARRNYFTSYVVLIVGLAGSIVAGALGLFAGVPSWIVGLVALLPGAATLLSRELRLQEKANFHYARCAEYEALRRRAAYSSDPRDSVGQLAAEMSDLARQGNASWPGLNPVARRGDDTVNRISNAPTDAA